jgi:hypothetical protein
MITLFSLLLFALGALAVDVPIFLTGALVDATATDDTYNTGGTISINGWLVNVPKNMLVTFPAAFVPWKDFVANKTAVMGFEVTVSVPQLQCGYLGGKSDIGLDPGKYCQRQPPCGSNHDPGIHHGDQPGLH